MKKFISMLMVFMFLFLSAGQAFASSRLETNEIQQDIVTLENDQDYLDYQNALKNVMNDDGLSVEMKEAVAELIHARYQKIIENGEVSQEEFIIETQSLPPFTKIAEFHSSIGQVQFFGDALTIFGSVIGLGGRIPLIGWGFSVVGGFMIIAGATVWITTARLESDAYWVVQNWFRWTNEATYEYEVYTRNWVELDGAQISEIVTTPIQSGNYN